MAFKYKATKAGTLNPFRYVEQGETVVSDVEIECSWLVPIEQFKEKKPLPITATSEKQMTRNPQTPAFIPPVASSDAYNEGMAQINALEKRQDAEAAAAQQQTPAFTPEPQPAPIVNNGVAENKETGEAPQTGTGDQDVLG